MRGNRGSDEHLQRLQKPDLHSLVIDCDQRPKSPRPKLRADPTASSSPSSWPLPRGCPVLTASQVQMTPSHAARGRPVNAGRGVSG